jgi:hypothetical protein
VTFVLATRKYSPLDETPCDQGKRAMFEGMALDSPISSGENA